MKISDSSMGHAPWAALAIFSGVVATLASLAITYPAHSHARRGVLQSQTGKGITFSANLVLSGISILLGIVAAGRGPVAVVFPLSVGSNLLSNMILQLALGIAHYTKNMMTGTLVLATAVMILPDVGPSEVPVGFDAADVLERPAAVVFVACSFVCVGLGLSIILRGTVKDNNGVLLFIYTVVNGSATVLSTSISKLVQMHLSLHVQVPMLMLYVLLGAFCLGMAAIANATLQDPSVFVPVGAGVNLVLTFMAGLCIWGDWGRLEHKLSYIMVYILVVLGTYSVSSFDFLSKEVGQIEANRYVAAKQNMRCSALCGAGAAASPFVPHYDSQYEPTRSSLRRRFDDLLFLWVQEPADSDKLRVALMETLKLGLDREYISHGAIAELFVSLADDPLLCPAASYRSEKLEAWLKQTLKHRRRLTSDLQGRDISFEAIDRGNSLESGDSLQAALLRTASPVD